MGREDFNANSVAKQIFNCVSELKTRNGINYIVSILVGSKSQKILNHHHDLLLGYGILKDYSYEQVKLLLIELIEQDYIFQTRDQYPVLFLLDKARQVMAGNTEAELKEPNPELAKKWQLSGESMEKTVVLFKTGKSVTEIAKERGISPETVINHLALAYQRGIDVDIDQFIPTDKQTAITQAFQKMGTEYLTPVKQSLGLSYTWEDLKLVRAKMLRPNSAIIN